MRRRHLRIVRCDTDAAQWRPALANAALTGPWHRELSLMPFVVPLERDP